jgi:hypothetical protein
VILIPAWNIRDETGLAAVMELEKLGTRYTALAPDRFPKFWRD